MGNSNERKLLQIVKYTPAIIILLSSIMITSFLYDQYSKSLELRKNKSRIEFINRQKRLIKEYVNTVYGHMNAIDKSINEKIDKFINQNVINAHKIATTLYEKYKDTKTQEEIKEIIATALKEIRFQNGESYIITVALDGEIIVHPTAPLGMNVFAQHKQKGISELYLRVFEKLKIKNDYYTFWYWKKIESKKHLKKVGYFKLFKPYNWAIGTGVYVKDIEDSLKRKIIDEVSAIRFNEGRSFIAIIDLEDYTLLTHEIKEFIGKNTLNIISDPLKIKEYKEILKKGEGYLTFFYNERNENITVYIKTFPKWNYAIATSFSNTEIEEIIKEKEKVEEEEFLSAINTLFIISALFTIILLLFSTYISRVLEKMFLAYKKQVKIESEKKLKEVIDKESQYNDLFTKNKMIQLLIDPESLLILDINEAAINFYGYTKEEFEKLKISDLNTLSEEQIRAEIQRATSMKNDYFEFKHRLKSGEEKDVKVHSIPATFKNKKVLCSTIEDITNQLQTKYELIKSKQIYENMFKLTNVGMFVTKADLKVVDVNKKFLDMLGYSKEEVLKLDMYGITYEGDYNNSAEKYKKALNKEIDSFILEKKYQKKDGSLFDAILSSKMVRDENGELLYALGTVLDVTEFKKKDTLLLQQSKMASMGEMLSNIAHQWRQPLSLISTLSSGSKLQKELGLLTKDKEIEAFEKIIEVTLHLSNTIEDFRTFFQPDRRQEEFSTSELYEKVLKLIEAKFKNSGIQIITNIEEIMLDSYMNNLLQVVLNIFLNAFDAFENLSDRKLIFFEIYRKGQKVIFEIKDNAGGIEESIIDRVFEPYFTTKHQFNGTGIGLYMSEEIVKRHLDGKITVENEKFIYEDKSYTGAKFIIELDIEY